jgi:hypothetical protein
MIKAKPTSLLLLIVVLAFWNAIWMHYKLAEVTTATGDDHPETARKIFCNTTATSLPTNDFLLRQDELEEQARVDAEIFQQLLLEQRQKTFHDNPYNISNSTAILEWNQAQSAMVHRILYNHHLTAQHAPQPEWNDESFPDVNIVGFQKAGTSHLYKLLATHKSTVTVKGKEYCIDPGHALVYDTNDYYYEDDVELQKQATQTRQRKLFDWHKSIYQKRQGLSYPSQRKLLNGCLQFDELEFRIRYHPPTSFNNNNKLFLVILRDPANWMWAVFNFWYDRHLDTNSPDTQEALLISGTLS